MNMTLIYCFVEHVMDIHNLASRITVSPVSPVALSLFHNRPLSSSTAIVYHVLLVQHTLHNIMKPIVVLGKTSSTHTHMHCITLLCKCWVIAKEPLRIMS